MQFKVKLMSDNGALESGVVAGYPVIDVRVSMTGGDYHPVDSSELAFKTAGSMAFQAAMERAVVVVVASLQ